MNNLPTINTRNYIFLQNLIAPYRVALFNELEKNGWSFAVFYMRETEDGRSWRVDQETMKYPFRIFKGWYIHSTRVASRFHTHFNWRLIWYLLTHQRHEIILGGAWNNLNVIVLILLKRLKLLRSRLHMWTEANFLKPGAVNCSALKHHMRKFVFNGIDGNIIVASKVAEETMKRWDVKAPHLVFLPNVVQEQLLIPATESATRPGELPMVVMSARLDKNVKGQLNFFEAIGEANVRRARFYLVGDGDDQPEYERYIAEHQYHDHIFLTGFCHFDEVVSYYARCDIFCLPSFYDACPLAVYEGLAMGLPMLVSDRCGNAGEAVIEGENGYTFNPYDSTEIRNRFEMLLSMPKNWEMMRRCSRALFECKFSAGSVVKNFITGMGDNSLQKGIGR